MPASWQAEMNGVFPASPSARISARAGSWPMATHVLRMVPIACASPIRVGLSDQALAKLPSWLPAGPATEPRELASVWTRRHPALP